MTIAEQLATLDEQIAPLEEAMQIACGNLDAAITAVTVANAAILSVENNLAPLRARHKQLRMELASQ